MSKQLRVKIIVWLCLLGSGSFLAVKFGWVVAACISLNSAAIVLISWIDDVDKGRI